MDPAVLRQLLGQKPIETAARVVFRNNQFDQSRRQRIRQTSLFALGVPPARPRSIPPTRPVRCRARAVGASLSVLGVRRRSPGVAPEPGAPSSAGRLAGLFGQEGCRIERRFQTRRAGVGLRCRCLVWRTSRRTLWSPVASSPSRACRRPRRKECRASWWRLLDIRLRPS